MELLFIIKPCLHGSPSNIPWLTIHPHPFRVAGPIAGIALVKYVFHIFDMTVKERCISTIVVSVCDCGGSSFKIGKPSTGKIGVGSNPASKPGRSIGHLDMPRKAA